MRNSPFHDSNSKPLPDANDIEQELLGSRKPADNPASLSDNDARIKRFEANKRTLRNILLGLLIAGLLLGGALSVGLIWAMGRLNLIEPNRPEQQEYQI